MNKAEFCRIIKTNHQNGETLFCSGGSFDLHFGCGICPINGQCRAGMDDEQANKLLLEFIRTYVADKLELI
jgi:hypothetical protein